MMSSLLQDVEASLYETGKAKFKLWTDSEPLMEALQQEGFLESNGGPLAALIVESSGLIVDSYSRTAVETVLKKALISSPFLKTFAGVLVKNLSHITGKRQSFYLLKWTCWILDKLEFPESQKPISKLLLVVAKCLESLQKSTERDFNRASKPLKLLLTKDIRFCKEALEIKSPSLMKVVCSLLVKPESKVDELRASLLESYISNILGAKTAPKEESIEAFQPFLSTLTRTEFSESILPSLLRCMRRNPDVVLGVSVRLFKAVNIDLSAFQNELQKVLLQFIRHSNVSIQSSAIEAQSFIAKQISDRDVLMKSVQTLHEILSGKSEGKVKNIQERVYLTKALKTLATSPSKRKDSSGEIVEILCQLYNQEGNDDVKVETLGAIGTWLKSCSVFTDPIVRVLNDALSGKEVLKTEALNALSTCRQNTELFTSGTALVPNLCKIVQYGLTKTTHRLEGITAFLILTFIASLDPNSDAVIAKSDIWKQTLDSGCPFYDPVAISKLADPVCELLIALCQNLLLLHVSHVDNTPGCLECISRALMLLCLHRSKFVRSTAFVSVSRCLGSSSILLLNFLEAFGHWQKHLETVKSLSLTEAESHPSMTEIRWNFHNTLLNLVSLGIDSRSEVLTSLLLKAYHPILQSSKNPGKLWKILLKRSSDILPTFQSAAEDVVGALLSPQGLESTDQNEREAALGALTITAESFPEILFEKLLNWSQKKLEISAAESLTESDILIWQTPEGRLSTDTQSNIVIVPDDKKKQVKKKPKGRYRHEKVAFAERSNSSSSEEEEESQSQKPRASTTTQTKAGSKGKKTGHLDAAERQMMFRERQLTEEAEIRHKVDQIKIRFEIGLEALTAFVKGNASSASIHLESLSALILPLLTSPLVGEGAAFEAMEALVFTLPEPLNLIPMDVAVVLRLIAIYQNTGTISLEEVLQHGCTIAVMHGIAAAKLQGGPAFFLVLPVLQAVLQSVDSPFFDSGLMVLASNCVFGDQLPRTEVASLLLHVLTLTPASRSLIEDALKKICGFLKHTELHSILTGLLNSNSVVRSVTLKSLFQVPEFLEGVFAFDSHVASLLLIACHDADSENAELAQELFESSGSTVNEDLLVAIAPFIGHEIDDIRSASVGAIVQCLESFQGSVQGLLEKVLTTVQDEGTKSWWLGSALMIEKCASLFSITQAREVLLFLMIRGLSHADDQVREKMVSAGLSVVDNCDPEEVDSLFQLIDDQLTVTKSGDRDHAADDRMREGAVVLLGSMAQHLTSEDNKLKNIISNLLEVLSTPSEGVQKAASICLSPLIQKRQSDEEYIQTLIKGLKRQLTTGSNFGVRRGAAYGIAGMVKGLGISSLRNHGIMESLCGFVEDKSNAIAREGGIGAFDCLSQRLGKLFEPYVIQILPLMLTCFGDSSNSVRQATAEAARTIMHNLSAHGVKLVLPSLMKGLEDKAWRTKQGSIQLLGAMAWCAPKQLSSCLPMIVPKLITVLADPHPKVHAAAEQALEEVGTTIRNPEIQQLVPDILSAISQPTKNTVQCLDKLLEAKFVNTIDASSLALIVPVVHRGLKDRTGENKKLASRIVQNLCKLVNDSKDMDPYMELLLPELKRAIVDPLPDVRAQASKALSSLMYDMGKKALDEVMPWLMETLESKASSVERFGAAQALAEVVAVFGEDYFESLLPKIIQNCTSQNAVLREGGIAVFRFLPYSMPDIFQKKLVDILPCILDGLADENEPVREVSLTAGRTLVEIYAQSSLPLILPAVEQSLFSENWRIRQSSVELLGNLFFKVAGTSGKVKLDGGSDDEGPATQSYGRNLIAALGFEKRNSVLAKLYMLRSDVQHAVRTSALHIWKTVVVNTPKTLMEMLSSVMDLVVEMLAFGGEDGRQTSSRCLGELVKKMGDRVLPQIIPTLETCFQSENVQTREGVCYGLRELLDSLSSAQMGTYLPVLLPTIQGSLCDPDPAVREVAAVAFDALFKAGPSSVVDSVVPDLLQKLDQEKERQQALEGLRVILSIRPHTLGSVLPKLLKEPLNVSRIHAIASLAEVAAGSLRHNLPSILRVLLKQGSFEGDDELISSAQEAAVKVSMAIPDENLHLVVSELRRGMDDISERFCSAFVIAALGHSRTMNDHLSSLLQTVLSFMSEDDPRILEQCWKALNAVARAVPKELQSSFIRVMKESIDTAKEKQRRKDPTNPEIIVPGFSLPKALEPILPFYLSGINQGASAELRELSAEGLGELVQIMDPLSLKPFVFQIIGPLIKISGERFPWQIKLAILKTMGLLISKVGEDVKKFVSALQPIFIKSLQDLTAASIRECAAENLGRLSLVNQRIDQLITNLITAAAEKEPPIRSALLLALTEALVMSGDRVSEGVLAKTGAILEDLIRPVLEEEEDVVPLAKCMGSFCKHCEIGFMTEFLNNQLTSSSVIWSDRHFVAVLMASIAKHCPDRLYNSDLIDTFHNTMSRLVRDDKVPVKKAICRCAARIVRSQNPEALNTAIPVLVTCLGPDQSTEMHEEALKSIQLISHDDCEVLKPHLINLVPLICALVKESTGNKKLHCETALTLILDLDDGFIAVREFLAGNPGATAKALLADPYLRRIQKLNKLTEFEPEEY